MLEPRPADPLGAALLAAADRAESLAVRNWLLLMAGSNERAESTSARPVLAAVTASTAVTQPRQRTALTHTPARPQ